MFIVFNTLIPKEIRRNGITKYRTLHFFRNTDHLAKTGRTIRTQEDSESFTVTKRMFILKKGSETRLKDFLCFKLAYSTHAWLVALLIIAVLVPNMGT